MATEMEKYFAAMIEAAKESLKKLEDEFEVARKAAKDDIERWEQAEAAHKNAVEKGEMHRTKAPALIPLQPDEPLQPTRQNAHVAPVIKEAISSIPAGQPFTTRDVFEQFTLICGGIFAGAIITAALYDKLRPSISAWLQNYVKAQEIEKIDRGVYRLPPKEGDIE